MRHKRSVLGAKAPNELATRFREIAGKSNLTTSRLLRNMVESEINKQKNRLLKQYNITITLQYTRYAESRHDAESIGDAIENEIFSKIKKENKSPHTIEVSVKEEKQNKI